MKPDLKSTSFTDRVYELFRRGWVEVPSQRDRHEAKRLLLMLNEQNPKISGLSGPKKESKAIRESLKRALAAIAAGLPGITAKSKS